MYGVVLAVAGLATGVVAAGALSQVAEMLAPERCGPLGRCAHCGAKLPPRAFVPMIRHGAAGACKACAQGPAAGPWFDVLAILGTALVVVLSGGHTLGVDLLVLWLGLVASAVDLHRRAIPNRLLLAASLLALIALAPNGPAAYLDGLYGLIALLGVGLLIAWIGRGGFGLGDVKYLGVLGLALGWQRGVATLVLAVLLGGFYALWLLVTHRATAKDAFAFGPFIALGSVVVALLGSAAGH